MSLTVVLPVVAAAFLASLVEAVEALTIVLAVGSVRGWRPAVAGALLGLLSLAAAIVAFGPLLDRVPIQVLQLAIGLLLLLFGMRWLRKAILRAAGIIALHDETLAFAKTSAELSQMKKASAGFNDRVGILTSLNAVVVEGLEVVFIVIAIGAGRGLLLPAAIGAAAACLLVAGACVLVHRPLARVPENTLKLAVGVMLSSFGLFWIGEALAVPWPGADLSIVGLILLFLVVSLACISAIRRPREARP